VKRLLIISPHFPPVNAADMHRIRTSLPYYKELGWTVEIVTVDDRYVDIVKDPLLMESIPKNIPIHKTKALSKKWTSKLGLGSLALRSFLYYRYKVNRILTHNKFDLIYFSTTEFPICALGAYWKKKYGVPYVIDMQDPWHTEYYKDKPKNQRPKKYWFSYRLHKYLEPKAMQYVDGITSVSESYIETLKQRYIHLNNKPTRKIIFGAFDFDLEIAQKNYDNLKLGYNEKADKFNLVYIGRGGYDMRDAVKLLFEAFKKGIKENSELFKKFHFHFVGTSYASSGNGVQTIYPYTKSIGLSEYVTEHTDRIGFYETIKTLQKADGLVIIGSNQAAYTASKASTYILTQKPLLAIFNKNSSVYSFIDDCNTGHLIALGDDIKKAYNCLSKYLSQVKDKIMPITNWQAFEPYTAKSLTIEQVNLFNEIVNQKNQFILNPI